MASASAGPQGGPPQDPSVPIQTVREILDLADQRLQALRKEMSSRFLGQLESFAADPYEAQQQRLNRYRLLPDSADNRKEARSLLSSLGVELAGTPENVRPDSGDAAVLTQKAQEDLAQNPGVQVIATAGQAVTDLGAAAGALAQDVRTTAEQMPLTHVAASLSTGVLVFFGAVGVVGGGALLWALVSRGKRKRGT